MDITAASDFFRSLQSYTDRLWSGNYRIGVVVLELLLIGLVVYSVLRFLQGTRGARLIKGVALVLLSSFVVVRLVAQQFEMDRITYLYPYFVSSVFLIALVVFQTELRRGLMRLGEGKLFQSRGHRFEKMVEPVVEAVGRLSKRKVGALIAIERTTEVGALVDSGIRLHAEISVELLETIFRPGSSLHDMGVIIQRGRIAAAACQFPLADFDEVDRALGSRHRAAVGMSQDCDALVIVVSEETGIISLSELGQLYRRLTPEELRTLLYAGLSGESLADLMGKSTASRTVPTAGSFLPGKTRKAQDEAAIPPSLQPTRDEPAEDMGREAGHPASRK